MKKYKCEVEAIQWNGKNTTEVVAFCCVYTDLCGIYEVVAGDTLRVEPADTMRGSSVYIPLNGYAVRMKNGTRVLNVIQAYCQGMFNANFNITK